MESRRFREVIRGKTRKVFQAEGRLRVREKGAGVGGPETNRGWCAGPAESRGLWIWGSEGHWGTAGV